MTVDVLVPWAGGCEQRQRLVHWTINQYEGRWPVVLGSCAPGPFNRSAAIMDAASKSTADVFVVSDADCFCDPSDAIEAVGATGWAVPHALVHRLSAESTEKVLAGAEWRGLPLSTDNAQDRKPYKGNLAGTLFVVRRDVLLDVPPDVRFRGWGAEDSAHALALTALVGRPWRGRDDLVHLWHPPQPRMSRTTGSRESAALLGRYRAAARRPDRMRVLVDEAKGSVAA